MPDAMACRPCACCSTPAAITASGGPSCWPRDSLRRAVGLAEVLDQEPMPAGGALAVVVHLPELRQGARRRQPLGHQDGPPQAEVAAGVEQQAFRRQAVAPRPTRLLLVVLEGLGHAGVDHGAHVGSVDPHPERHRGHDDIRPLRDELLLGPPALGIGEAGMVCHRPDTPAP